MRGAAERGAVVASLIGALACGDGGSSRDSGPPDSTVEPSRDGGPRDAGEVFGPCEGPDPRGDAFSEGPYGAAVLDRAADFTVPTLDGGFRFREEWTGCDSHVFVLYDPSNDYSRHLWGSSVAGLIDGTLDGSIPGSPEGAHYFFLSYASDPSQAMAHVSGVRDSVEAAFAELGPGQAARWRPRMHFVTTPALALGNWISEMLRTRSVVSFGIDRFQRIRETGLLYPFTVTDRPSLLHLASEVRYYDFEWAREQRLRSEEATILDVLDAEPIEGEVFVDVDFPDLSAFDTMELDLSLSCPQHRKENCPAWDYIADLKLCDGTGPAGCSVQVGRWITPYWAEGRWVTDVSGMLALLGGGGPRRLRFFSSQPYIVGLRVRLSSRAKPGRPQRAVYLWSGGTFDESYNTLFEPRTVPVPVEARRVELYAVISGHGFGGDAENCAEFCNHTHHFAVNGSAHVKDHPDASSRWGCLLRAGEGVVPNQSGTWFFGRGGWCPGLDVAPWVVDVTDDVTPGTDANVSYVGMLRSMPYMPRRTSMDFNANIIMDSYLIFYW